MEEKASLSMKFLESLLVVLRAVKSVDKALTVRHPVRVPKG